MQDRRPGPASGCDGRLQLRGFLLSPAVVPVMSMILGRGDRDGVVAIEADRSGVRVVGEDGARSSQLVDEVRGLGGAGGLHGATVVRHGVVSGEDGQGGQVRQDLIFADVGVLRLAGSRAGGAGAAMAAPVSGPPVGPGCFQPGPHLPQASSPASR